ncbi:MAG TPA: PAS domain-containing protein [Novosphingobium sp.]|nr:PAS domain-containing protein [Novosphingobium sp.]HZV08637.1 PAS domain-containing protein [Novosphingobium sp.]
MIASSALAAILCDPRQPDTPIVACNAPFLALTGYARAEVLGRNCRFLQGPATQPVARQQLREAIAARRPVMVDILNYRKDGSPFRNAVMVAPIFDAAGELEYFLGSQVALADAVGEVLGDGWQISARAAARRQVDGLSPRQRNILLEMTAGKLNKQIAWELGLAERTIKMHRAALLRALGVTSSAEAIRLAVEAGF